MTEDWGPAQNLGPTINGPYDDAAAFVSIDGHHLYFQSNRPEGYGGGDLYVSRRHDKRQDFGPDSWQTPGNLGPAVNSAADESSPWLFEDDKTGSMTLYFVSNRAGGPGPIGPNAPGFPGQQGADIYISTYGPDEAFGPVTQVAELDTTSFDERPSVSRDGLEIYFTSNRPGSLLNAAGQPSFDLWVAKRESTSDPWSTPVFGRGDQHPRPRCGSSALLRRHQSLFPYRSPRHSVSTIRYLDKRSKQADWARGLSRVRTYKDPFRVAEGIFRCFCSIEHFTFCCGRIYFKIMGIRQELQRDGRALGGILSRLARTRE